MKKGLSLVFAVYVILALLFMQGCDPEERQYIRATEDILEHEAIKYIESQWYNE